MAARIAQISQKRATLKIQTTTLRNAVAQKKIDKTNMKLRLTRLTELFHAYEEMHDELAVLDSSNDGLNQMLEIQEEYYELAAAVENILGANILPEPSGESTMIERQRLLKLPVAELPKFNGDNSKWLTFKNTFMSMVDGRTDIDDLTKFLYLRNSLEGEAANKLSLFDASIESYQTAWNLLTDSYERKRVLISRHLDSILDIEPLKKATSKGLIKIVDDVRQHMSMLKSLTIRPDERIIVRILERSLPSDIRQKWEELLDLDSLPNFEQFCKFMNETAHRLSALEQDTTRTKTEKRSGERENQTTKFRKNEHGARTFVTAPSSSCAQCKGTHPVFKCPAFEKLTVRQRWDVIKAKRLCRNCLRSHVGECPSNFRCKQCKRFHHTLLHSAVINPTVSREASTVTSNAKSTESRPQL